MSDLDRKIYSANDAIRIENIAHNKALEDLVKKCENAKLYHFGQQYVDIRDIREFKKELTIK